MPPSVPVPTHRNIWSWFIGLLVPVIGIILSFQLGHIPLAPDTYTTPSFFAIYINQFSEVLLLVVFAPLIVGGVFHIPGVISAVAGFGVPSLFGLALTAVGWVLFGKGMYVLYHSRARWFFWGIVAVVIGGLLVASYFFALAAVHIHGSVVN